MGFGFNGVSTMIKKQNGVAARLKEKVNSFLTSIQCVAHRINIAAIHTIKVGPYKDTSKKINVFFN